ncbi:MAG: site-specific integrase [Lachnospiraceae bacterium]|nr:site-specific integrase [Lachnospiraceae bacterium]
MSRAGKYVYKRKDGRWEGRYIKCHVNGRAKYGSVYGHSCEEAKQKLAKAKIMLENETQKISAGVVRAVGKKWIDEASSRLKESSVNKYESILDNYIYPKFGDFELSDITNGDIIDFSNKLIKEGGVKKKGLSVSTVNQIMSVLNSLRIHALRRNCTVCFTTECVSLKSETTGTRVFTLDEEEKLITYLENNYNLTSLGILLCLFSGLRVGELSALKWDDFDFSEGTFEVCKTMQRVKVKAGYDKKTVVKILEPKSKCSKRIIPIPENLRKMLLSEKVEGAFVLTGNKDRFIEPRTMQNRFKQILKKAEISDANFHTTRHTYATRCVEEKVDTKCLSEMLGHASVAITLNRYVHPSMELKAQHLAKLTSRFPINITVAA